MCFTSTSQETCMPCLLKTRYDWLLFTLGICLLCVMFDVGFRGLVKSYVEVVPVSHCTLQTNILSLSKVVVVECCAVQCMGAITYCIDPLPFNTAMHCTPHLYEYSHFENYISDHITSSCFSILEGGSCNVCKKNGTVLTFDTITSHTGKLQVMDRKCISNLNVR
jgi:hypothetical protein